MTVPPSGPRPHRPARGIDHVVGVWLSRILYFVLVANLVACDDATRTGPWKNVPKRRTHVDHSTFFDQPFADGPAVTRACLECHPDASKQVMKTSHWHWQGDPVEIAGHSGKHRIGKKNLINNFCIGVISNWGGCTSCHAGFGWDGPDFDFDNPELVDCLGCHDQSGTYAKQSNGAGRPDPSVDLLVVARSVGAPKRANCGSCHFMGGGGDGVKHGDMDRSLLNPSPQIDVHAGKHGFQCTDCHHTRQHQIKGRAMSVSVDSKNEVACTDCHEDTPHNDSRLNAHVERIACQACHVPSMSRIDGTKLSWDWSAAGQDLEDKDPHEYLKIKGRFTWAKGALPTYRWYNGRSTRYLLGDKINPTKVTAINAPLGDRRDPQAKIWPFKRHVGRQIYDTKHLHLLVPNTVGPDGYWTKFDWKLAAQKGAEAAGLAFSGQYDFAPTEMFWPLTHMVTPKDSALSCRDCHGARGRLDWKALGYEKDPLYEVAEAHDPIVLRDEDEVAVTESQKPLSTVATCGECHELDDDEFLDKHRLHRSLQLDRLPPERARLMSWGPRLNDDTDQEPNCLMCHLANPNVAARMRAIESNQQRWSITATLEGTGIVEATGEGWQWVADSFDDGEVTLALTAAREEDCGTCHGLVHNSPRPLKVALGTGRWSTTENTGQIFSGQRMRLSALNLVHKDDLSEPWDVHAERLVSCKECHYAQKRPARLSGKPASSHEPEVRRRCQSCHSLEGLHRWLPEQQKHFATVACESCHASRLAMAARSLVDQTVVHTDGESKVLYRGVVSGDVRDPVTAYIEGYQPTLAKLESPDGKSRLTPVNFVGHLRWMSADKPVARSLVQRAFLTTDGYRSEVQAALDSNQDGTVSTGELRLDTSAKVALIQSNLAKLGVDRAMIRAELRPYPIHHGIKLGEATKRVCTSCHAYDETTTADAVVLPYLPPGITAELVPSTSGESVALDGKLERRDDASLIYRRQLGSALRGDALPKEQGR
jgi:octaheme c-type cytochrome (tetrathionate reductase family)